MPRDLFRRHTRKTCEWTAEEVEDALKQHQPEKPANALERAKRLNEAYGRIPIGARITLSANEFKIMEEVSSGVFGFTFLVKEIYGYKERLWLRTEPKSRDPSLSLFRNISKEIEVLQKASKPENYHEGLEYIVNLVTCGSLEKVNYLVHQELGDNLNTVMRARLKSAFSFSTALRVCIQTLRAVEALHHLGYLHRFLRPDVYFVGLGDMNNRVYLANFGLPFYFRENDSNAVKPPRSKVKLLGAKKYMSRNAHKNRELGRRDDIESWFYMCLEFFDLEILPWENDRSAHDVYTKKQMLLDGEYMGVFINTSNHMFKLAKYIKKMKYEEKPDYKLIISTFIQFRREKNIDCIKPLDWEELPYYADRNEPKETSPVKSKYKIIKGVPSRTPSRLKTLKTQEESVSETTHKAEDLIKKYLG